MGLIDFVAGTLGQMVGKAASLEFVIPALIVAFTSKRWRQAFLYAAPAALVGTLVFIWIVESRHREFGFPSLTTSRVVTDFVVRYIAIMVVFAVWHCAVRAWRRTFTRAPGK